MARTDDDSWDIATSVGATAVMVAMARAAETAREDALIRDQFAELLVSTPELEQVRTQVSAWWSAGSDDDPDEDLAGFRMDAQQMINYQAVRTHFFDAFFADATAGGIRQVVILAAGLDSRAYRLAWPAGTVVYEIDLPKVLEYKTETLAAHGAGPTATLCAVPVDLRHDWPKALRANGFDASEPTAWLAEGLLPFLPGQAQEAMFVAVDELSAPGSRIAVEVFGVDAQQRQEIRQRSARLRAARAKRGEDVSFDPFTLWYDEGDRPDCAEWFAAHAWTTETVGRGEESARLGRQPSTDDVRRANAFVTAGKR